MSNLLEQAIIDAAALRETALKSAEAALIDKYKDEFRNSIEKLLEQDENLPPPEGGEQVGGEVGSLEPTIDQNTPEEQAGGEAFDDVPSSFLDGDDDELITIDFDKLEKQLGDMLSSPVLAAPDMNTGDVTQNVSPDQSAAQLEEELDLTLEEESCDESETEEQDELEEDLELESLDSHSFGKDASDPTGMKEEVDEDSETINLTISDEEESEEEYELEETDMGTSSAEERANLLGQKAQLDAKIARVDQEHAKETAQAAKQGQQQPEQSDEPMTEDFELTEEEISELEEALKVDIDPHKQSRGYMGTTETEEEILHNLEKAAARDDEEIEEREEEKKRLKDLEEELTETKKQNKKYSILVEELKDNLITLKEHTEKLSVSNAKLLYINKVFGNSSLNERQKQGIVESISRAKSVLEARTIYDTLQSTLEGISVKKPKESLGEALNRGSTGFISRPKQTSVDENISDRLRILAGIKKD